MFLWNGWIASLWIFANLGVNSIVAQVLALILVFTYLKLENAEKTDYIFSISFGLAVLMLCCVINYFSAGLSPIAFIVSIIIILLSLLAKFLFDQGFINSLYKLILLLIVLVACSLLLVWVFGFNLINIGIIGLITITAGFLGLFAEYVGSRIILGNARENFDNVGWKAIVAVFFIALTSLCSIFIGLAAFSLLVVYILFNYKVKTKQIISSTHLLSNEAKQVNLQNITQPISFKQKLTFMTNFLVMGVAFGLYNFGFDLGVIIASTGVAGLLIVALGNLLADELDADGVNEELVEQDRNQVQDFTNLQLKYLSKKAVYQLLLEVILFTSASYLAVNAVISYVQHSNYFDILTQGINSVFVWLSVLGLIAIFLLIRAKYLKQACQPVNRNYLGIVFGFLLVCLGSIPAYNLIFSSVDNLVVASLVLAAILITLTLVLTRKGQTSWEKQDVGLLGALIGLGVASIIILIPTVASALLVYPSATLVIQLIGLFLGGSIGHAVFKTKYILRAWLYLPVSIMLFGMGLFLLVSYISYGNLALHNLISLGLSQPYIWLIVAVFAGGLIYFGERVSWFTKQQIMPFELLLVLLISAAIILIIFFIPELHIVFMPNILLGVITSLVVLSMTCAILEVMYDLDNINLTAVGMGVGVALVSYAVSLVATNWALVINGQILLAMGAALTSVAVWFTVLGTVATYINFVMPSVVASSISSSSTPYNQRNTNTDTSIDLTSSP